MQPNTEIGMNHTGLELAPDVERWRVAEPGA